MCSLVVASCLSALAYSQLLNVFFKNEYEKLIPGSAGELFFRKDDDEWKKIKSDSVGSPESFL